MRVLIAVACASLVAAGCHADSCHEESSGFTDSVALGAPPPECTQSATGDACPVETCRALCPRYAPSGYGTVSVHAIGCRHLPAIPSGVTLVCAYRTIYDVCGY
jgi:hypothetical protein